MRQDNEIVGAVPVLCLTASPPPTAPTLREAKAAALPILRFSGSCEDVWFRLYEPWFGARVRWSSLGADELGPIEKMRALLLLLLESMITCEGVFSVFTPFSACHWSSIACLCVASLRGYAEFGEMAIGPIRLRRLNVLRTQGLACAPLRAAARACLRVELATFFSQCSNAAENFSPAICHTDI